MVSLPGSDSGRRLKIQQVGKLTAAKRRVRF